jgi:hypothetical protein
LAISGRWAVVITVSRMPDERYEFLVGLHELIEAYLCKTRGISEASVTAFDTGVGANLDEPGDDPRAPYHNEHVFATKVERMMAAELVDKIIRLIPLAGQHFSGFSRLFEGIKCQIRTTRCDGLDVAGYSSAATADDDRNGHHPHTTRHRLRPIWLCGRQRIAVGTIPGERHHQ